VKSRDYVDMSNYVTNGEWSFVGTRIIRNEVRYPIGPAVYPDVTVVRDGQRTKPKVSNEPNSIFTNLTTTRTKQNQTMRVLSHLLDIIFVLLLHFIVAYAVEGSQYNRCLLRCVVCNIQSTVLQLMENVTL